MRATFKSYLLYIIFSLLCITQFLFAAEADLPPLQIMNSEIEGVWEGELEAMGSKLRIVIHIVSKENGELKAVMDSPDQRARDIHVDEISLNENKLYFVVKSITGRYEGQLEEDGLTIKGTWTQGGSGYSLNLKKNISKKPREIKERKTADIDPAIYKDYIGRYQIAPTFILTVSTRDDKLFVQATSQPQIEVYPESETEFFYKIVNAQITFVRDKDGAVNKLILHQNGIDMDAARLAE